MSIGLCLLISSCYKIFSKATRAIEKQTKQSNVTDSLYSTLQNRYKLLIAYKPYNPSSLASMDEHEYIFCFNSLSNCTGYVSTKHLVQNVNNPLPFTVDSIKISRVIATSVINEFVKSEGWNLNYDDTIEDSADMYCFYKNLKPCFILHGQSYAAKFIVKKGQAVSYLYAPERYEKECCQGNINRQKFIAIKSIMDGAFKEAGLLSR
jgi:hypothetical protein